MSPADRLVIILVSLAGCLALYVMVRIIFR